MKTINKPLRLGLYLLASLLVLVLAPACRKVVFERTQPYRLDPYNDLKGTYWVQELPADIPTQLPSLIGAERRGQITFRDLYFDEGILCTLYEQEGESGGSSLSFNYKLYPSGEILLRHVRQPYVEHLLALSPDRERLYITTKSAEPSITRWDRLAFVRATQLNGLINKRLPSVP